MLLAQKGNTLNHQDEAYTNHLEKPGNGIKMMTEQCGNKILHSHLIENYCRSVWEQVGNKKVVKDIHFCK